MSAQPGNAGTRISSWTLIYGAAVLGAFVAPVAALGLYIAIAVYFASVRQADQLPG